MCVNLCVAVLTSWQVKLREEEGEGRLEKRSEGGMISSRDSITHTITGRGHTIGDRARKIEGMREGEREEERMREGRGRSVRD